MSLRANRGLSLAYLERNSSLNAVWADAKVASHARDSPLAFGRGGMSKEGSRGQPLETMRLRLT